MTTTTEERTTYNGWTNYATWRVNLELCDDTVNALLQDIPQYQEPFDGLSALADYLQESCEFAVDPEDADTLAHQYANAFLGQVNWWEIAKTHADDNPQLIVADIDEAPEQVPDCMCPNGHFYTYDGNTDDTGCPVCGAEFPTE